MNTLLPVTKEYCCGCGACAAVCARGAIRMAEDARGFVQPVADSALCTQCGACRRVCPMVQPQLQEPVQGFAAVCVDTAQRERSASGGAFAAIAQSFLEQGGVVCGAAMDICDGKAAVSHVLVEDAADLPRLQGSKYVQSDMRDAYPRLGQALRSGKQVLFSGTPCQAAAVRGLYGKRYPEQLFTVELVCHGVPNQRLMNDWLADLQREKGMTMTGFCFRDKRYGWELMGTLRGVRRDGTEAEYPVPAFLEPYYRFFMEGQIYRESCYRCPYAAPRRCGDLTLGDYWGIEKNHPQLLTKNGGALEQSGGISCILVNTRRGEALLRRGGGLRLESTPISSIVQGNDQLRQPVKPTARREAILSAYEKRGYPAVKTLYRRYKLAGGVKRRITKAAHLCDAFLKK